MKHRLDGSSIALFRCKPTFNHIACFRCHALVNSLHSRKGAMNAPSGTSRVRHAF